MDSLDTWNNPVVRIALYLVLHTYLRTDELRVAIWDQIDFDEGLWRVPAEVMKMDNEHWIPLSNQALDLLHQFWNRQLIKNQRRNQIKEATSRRKEKSY